MKFGVRIAVLILPLLLLSGMAQAAPKQGFGLYAGLASHTMTPNAGFIASTSNGLSIGVDYQIPMSEEWSLNPFLMSAGETSSESNVTVGHGILGLQARYWSGDMFFGGHVGSYSEVREVYGTTSSAAGLGGGLVAGWENPEGGLFITGQIDKATVKYSNADVALSGFRVNIGYRWK